jgi:hypothetical protein
MKQYSDNIELYANVGYMKKFLLLLSSCLIVSGLCSEETGFAAATSVEATENSNWQNWVFAASVLVTVTVGVVIVSLNSGTNSR